MRSGVRAQRGTSCVAAGAAAVLSCDREGRVEKDDVEARGRNEVVLLHCADWQHRRVREASRLAVWEALRDMVTANHEMKHRDVVPAA